MSTEIEKLREQAYALLRQADDLESVVRTDKMVFIKEKGLLKLFNWLPQEDLIWSNQDLPDVVTELRKILESDDWEGPTNWHGWLDEENDEGEFTLHLDTYDFHINFKSSETMAKFVKEYELTLDFSGLEERITRAEQDLSNAIDELQKIKDIFK
ncbi:MAG: hypothetical protein ACW99G_01350 [Candidatus Thorarchaeota archaeon]|jgi:hypothetical protein